MATISNTIKLQDKMTPVLRSITTALNSTLNALESTDTASSQAFKSVRRDVQSAIIAVDTLGSEIQDLKTPIDQAKSGFSGWKATVTGLNQGLQLVSQTIRTVVQGFNMLANFSDTQTGLTSRLNLMTGSLEETKKLQDAIFASAQRSRASYTATADSVAQMGMMAADAFKDVNGNLNTGELVAFTEAINKQLTISGAAGTAGADAALYQLTQAMSSGKLQGDELRSIMEQAPVLADTITEYVKGMDEAYANITKGDLRQLASDGVITAKVVKNAMLSSLGEIDGQFQQMPTTFGQAMVMLKNEATRAMQPVVEQFSNFVQSDTFQKIYQAAVNTLPHIIAYAQELVTQLARLAKSDFGQQLGQAFLSVVGFASKLLKVVVNIAVFIGENWGWISPIIYGVAAAMLFLWTVTHGVALAQKAATVITIIFTTAQTVLSIAMGVLTGSTAAASAAVFTFNSALYACPITWIILLIIALISIIFIVIGVINKVTGESISAIGVIVGALTTAVAFIYNIVIAVFEGILQAMWSIFVEPWIGIIEFVLNAFQGGFNSFGDAAANLFGQIIAGFLSLGKIVTKVWDIIFGTSLTKELDALQDKVTSWGKNEKAITISRQAPSLSDVGIKRWEYGDAWDSGYSFGEKTQDTISDALSGFDMSVLETPLGANADASQGLYDLASGKNGALQTEGKVSITEEDIKLLKDVAKTEWVNKYTTLRPELNVTFGDVHETADVNEIAAAVENMVVNAYASGLAY